MLRKIGMQYLHIVTAFAKFKKIQQRLLKKAFGLGLVEKERYKQYTQKEQQYQDFINKELKTKNKESFVLKLQPFDQRY